MGLHIVDIIIVAAIGLALFGSKALQSAAHEAGKTMGQAKQAKDKIMAEVPLDEITRIKGNIPQIPLNSRQAVQMLMDSDEKSND
jgi:Sec-independent protein translocase protein TatA